MMQSPRTVYMIMVWENRHGKIEIRTLTAAFSSKRLAEMIGQQMVMDGEAAKYKVIRVEVDGKNMLDDLLERREALRQNPSGKKMSARKKSGKSSPKVQNVRTKGSSLADISQEELESAYDAMRKSGYRSSVADMSRGEVESAFEDLQKRSRKNMLKKGLDPDRLLAEDVEVVFGPGSRVTKSRRLVTDKTSRKSISKSARRASKAPTKPKAKDLIEECKSLWESYCDRPSKMKLRKVDKHCDAMKASKYKTVKDKRRRCMNAVRREKKKLGI